MVIWDEGYIVLTNSCQELSINWVFIFLLGSLLFKTVIWTGYNIGDFFLKKRCQYVLNKRKMKNICLYPIGQNVSFLLSFSLILMHTVNLFRSWQPEKIKAFTEEQENEQGIPSPVSHTLLIQTRWAGLWERNRIVRFCKSNQWDCLSLMMLSNCVQFSAILWASSYLVFILIIINFCCF